jgi:AraC-like DNA-binding protein
MPVGFSFGEAVYAVGGYYGPLRRRYATLLVVEEGEAIVSFDGMNRIVRAGECGVFLNETDIGILYPAGRTSRVAWCETAPTGRLPLSLPSALPPASSTSSTPRILSLLRHGLDLGFAEGQAVNQLRNALGAALFAAYAIDAGIGAESAVPPPVLRARAHADRHFCETCDLDRLAEAAGVTPEHLVTAFRKSFGITPMRYVWELRTRKAIDLVQRSDLNLTEIADQCGYKSPYHLSREVKAMTGAAPRDLRRNQGYLAPTTDTGLAEDLHF